MHQPGAWGRSPTFSVSAEQGEMKRGAPRMHRRVSKAISLFLVCCLRSPAGIEILELIGYVSVPLQPYGRAKELSCSFSPALGKIRRDTGGIIHASLHRAR